MGKVTESNLLKAIKGSGGTVSAIAKRLGGVSWATARAAIDASEKALEAMEIEGELLLDLSEGVVRKEVEAGNLQAAKYVLSTKGKKRGFTYGRELSGEVVVKGDAYDWSSYSIEERKEILSRIKPNS